MDTVTQEEYEEAVAKILRARDEGVLQHKRASDKNWAISYPDVTVVIGDPHYQYRIKPQPREWWQVDCNGFVFQPFYSRELAERFAEQYEPEKNLEIIRVREVLEGEE